MVTFKLKGAGYSPFKALGKKSVQFLDLILDFIAVQLAVLRLVAQLCLTLCDTMDCSPPGSSVHEDSPGKNTGVVPMPSSGGFFLSRDQTQVSHIAGGFFIA